VANKPNLARLEGMKKQSAPKKKAHHRRIQRSSSQIGWIVKRLKSPRKQGKTAVFLARFLHSTCPTP
jgi:hypothetical protein